MTSTVVGNHNRGCAFVHGTFGIFSREHSFDDNRPGPDALEPANVFPGDDSPGKGSRDVDEGHRSLTRDNDVL